jgi:dTDP-4-dehydrorhamnose reductase
MKILLFGATGQIGQALAPRLARIADVVSVDRKVADLANPASVSDIITAFTPNIIVNAAAYTAVDAAEADAEAAHRVNADAPAAMARAAAQIGAAMIHFSTDYVFDGTAHTPYTEQSATNPLSVYGRTKLAGDEAIRSSRIPHLILRTTWLYSPNGRNFLNAILERARQSGTLRVVGDQTGAPTSAGAIADAVATILNRFPIERVSGTYNLTAAGSTSWYDFAVEILERCSVRASVERISSTELNAPARRPSYSILDNTKARETLDVALPHWREQLAVVLAGGSPPAT